MSATMPTSFDVQEQVARINRNLGETAKLFAEQTKLLAEHRKLSAEADKFRRERYLAAVLAGAALGATVASVLPTLLRAWEVH